MLNIQNLNVAIEQSPVLKDINLTIGPGEIHVIMGPNGSGKSTLSRALIGDEHYQVQSGAITLNGEDLLAMPIEERAQKGLFLGFQYPIALPGVSNIQFLKTSINHVRAAQGLEPLDSIDLLDQAKAALAQMGLGENFISRAVNDGFSGGEKKRNELVQLLMLKPKIAILDEIDSGLDIDALKIVVDCVRTLKEQGTAFILITHYKRFLDAIAPDRVHVLMNGSICKSGQAELVEEIETKGYQAIAA